jgi:hypothetical protein
MPSTRRELLQRLAGLGIVSSLADWGPWGELSALGADAKVTPELVALESDIEPIVRRIEETPRDKCFEMAVEQLRSGLSYRQFLAALFLAGIRNVNPRPPGFKFHCVFVIHSAHQLSLDAAPGERLLPLFWALDDFKQSQQEDEKQGDYRMEPISGSLPKDSAAWDEFHAAMEAWDQERAERAIAALARSRGAFEIIEGLWRYGARDYRNIGHKAIFVANSWRTLETIGWRHAEPVLRSLALGLLDFGQNKPVNNYAYADQAYLGNLRRAQESIAKLPGDWTAARGNESVTRDLLTAMRQEDIDTACGRALDVLAKGQAQSGAVWDAVHLAAGELMMRQPGIYGIHTVTSANALRYAFDTSGNPETRLIMLLQGVGWMVQFRNFMATKKLGDTKITELVAAEPAASDEAAIAETFKLLPKDRAKAAAIAYRFAQQQPEPGAFAAVARRMVFTKGTDPHDYKYTAAIFEDYRHVSPIWRPHMLATAVYNLPGNGRNDSPLMQRAREAVASLG